MSVPLAMALPAGAGASAAGEEEAISMGRILSDAREEEPVEGGIHPTDEPGIEAIPIPAATDARRERGRRCLTDTAQRQVERGCLTLPPLGASCHILPREVHPSCQPASEGIGDTSAPAANFLKV